MIFFQAQQFDDQFKFDHKVKHDGVVCADSKIQKQGLQK